MVEPLLALALAFAGAVVPAYLFGFNGRRWFLVGLSGLFGWATVLAGQAAHWGSVPALFAGACVVAAWSSAVEAVVRTPTPAVWIGGVFPLVPGLTAFQALEALLRRQTALAEARGGEAVAAALAVALGLLVVSSLARTLGLTPRGPGSAGRSASSSSRGAP